MIPSTHYYVLSLGEEGSNLYEAFRDTLIGVENQGFPIRPPLRPSTAVTSNSRRALMRTVDEHFHYYDSHERLGLILVGDEELQSTFDAVTTHASAVVGRLKGDRTGVDAADLGQMVWPLVKECLSAVQDRAMRELDECFRAGHVASGMEAVITAVGDGVRGTLLVEEDFHVRGSLATGTLPSTFSAEVDIRDVYDDAVDALIERVLAAGGNAIFMRSGALADRGRIALLRAETRKP